MTATKPGLRAVSLAVIYCRVSIDKKNRTSVDQQEAESREVAAEQGWRVDRVFTDNDRSASRHATKEREEYPALLEYLATADVGVLILWESSRGDRELERWAGLLNLCRRRGIRIHVVKDKTTYDLNVARQWKALAEDGVNNAYASEETRDRVLRDVRANAAKGKPHGKLLYGYRRIYDDRGNYLEQVEHPEQAAVVREAAARVRAGESLYSIAADFQARGIPTPRGGKGWRPEQIPRLVRNPGYVAKRVHQGEVVGDAAWPALLTDEVFADCVGRLSDPARRTVRENRAKHLLTGVTFCAHCPSRMFAQKAPRATDPTHTSLTCKGGFCVAVKEQPVEDFVTDLVIARLSQPDFLDLYGAPGAGDAGRARKEEKELQDRLDGFYASAATPRGISPEALAAIEAQLLPQLADAKRRSTTAPVPAVLRDAAGPGAARWWKAASLDQRRQVVRLLVEVRVSRVGRGTRTFRPAERLPASRWVGDVRTWGEHWAEDAAS